MAELPHTTEKKLKDEFFILGITSKGRQFRPSDWAERLCGVMSCFAPGAASRHSHLQFSPWVHPTNVNGVKAVVVSRELQKIDKVDLVGATRSGLRVQPAMSSGEVELAWKNLEPDVIRDVVAEVLRDEAATYQPAIEALAAARGLLAK